MNSLASFTHPAIPTDLHWQHLPSDWRIEPDGSLLISAGKETDWFFTPAGSDRKDNAPAALFVPPDDNFLLSAKVKVNFASAFDAGALHLRERDDLWAKLCFEFSPQRQPMIVSVVTRGHSDDSNSAVIGGDEVFLRIARNASALAFHYSLDGHYWHLVRHFTLGQLDNVQVGFSSQSPTGEGCTSVFSTISYHSGKLSDIRSGE